MGRKIPKIRDLNHPNAKGGKQKLQSGKQVFSQLVYTKAFLYGIMQLTEVWLVRLGRDAALRRPRPAGRNECVKALYFSVT
jgi:hypothetical protein